MWGFDKTGVRPGEERLPEPLLIQDELSDLKAVRAAVFRVTPEHARAAAHFEADGRRALADQRFGPASKALATAALYEPDATRLYLTAASMARIPRPRPDESEASAAKSRDYELARALLDVSEALASDDSTLTVALQTERRCLQRLVAADADSDCRVPMVPASNAASQR